jgi:hypothetical protein
MVVNEVHCNTYAGVKQATLCLTLTFRPHAPTCTRTVLCQTHMLQRTNEVIDEQIGWLFVASNVINSVWIIVWVSARVVSVCVCVNIDVSVRVDVSAHVSADVCVHSCECAC